MSELIPIKGRKGFFRFLVFEVLIFGLISFIPFIFPYMQNNSANAAQLQTNVQEESCRCCHGEHLPDRHHLLPENQCLDCHEMVWNPETTAYEFAPYRDCRLCHQHESTQSQLGTPDRHHIAGLGNGYGCIDCHPSRWDEASQSWYFGMLYDCDFPLYGNIEGNVTDINGNPLEGAKITITDHVRFSAMTDAGGFYILQDVYARDYSSIRAELNGYPVTESMPVTILDGQTLTVDLVMGLVGNITGIVTDIDGNVLEGVQITLDDTGYNTITGMDGFLFTNIPVGNYTVTAQLEGYDPSSMPVVVDHLQMSYADLVLDYPRGEIIGLVFDLDGNVLEGVNIRTENLWYSTQTDTAGSFTLQDVIAGDYMVIAESYGYETETKPASVLQGTKTKRLYFSMIQYPVPEVCSDGLDNDMDGNVDCSDKKDCKKNPACRLNYTPSSKGKSVRF